MAPLLVKTSIPDVTALSRDMTHEQTVGVARPSDFDEHVAAASMFDRADELILPIQKALRCVFFQLQVRPGQSGYAVLIQRFCASSIRYWFFSSSLFLFFPANRTKNRKTKVPKTDKSLRRHVPISRTCESSAKEIMCLLLTPAPLIFVSRYPVVSWLLSFLVVVYSFPLDNVWQHFVIAPEALFIDSSRWSFVRPLLLRGFRVAEAALCVLSRVGRNHIIHNYSANCNFEFLLDVTTRSAVH